MKRFFSACILALSCIPFVLFAQRNPDLNPSPVLQNPVSVTPAVGTTNGVSGINLQQQLQQQQQQHGRPISHSPVTNPTYQPIHHSGSHGSSRPGRPVHHSNPQPAPSYGHGHGHGHGHPVNHNHYPPVTVPVVVHTPVYVYQPIAAPRFHDFHCTLRNYWADNSRMIVVKQFIDNNYVTTEQIRQIAFQFPRDEHRLEVATFAYRRVADPFNYFRLMDIFAYANTARRFHDFILANEAYFRPAPCNGIAPAISDAEFGMVLQSIRSRAFDDTRVLMAKQVISFHSLYSHQVAAIMQQLAFDNSRLEIAKFAANRVIDPQNYYIVNDAFTFESSIRELNDWLMYR